MAPKNFLPELAKPLNPIDFRFSDRSRRLDRITYAITNGIWPEADDPILQSLFRQAQARMLPVREGSATTVRFAFFLLVVATCPVIYYAVRQRRKPGISEH